MPLWVGRVMSRARRRQCALRRAGLQRVRRKTSGKISGNIPGKTPCLRAWDKRRATGHVPDQTVSPAIPAEALSGSFQCFDIGDQRTDLVVSELQIRHRRVR